jgi:hypothetical protein
MRVFWILYMSLMLIIGCTQEEKAVPQKFVPVTIKVMNTQGQPVSHSVVGITAIVPKDLRKEVGAIPIAIRTIIRGKWSKSFPLANMKSRMESRKG